MFTLRCSISAKIIAAFGVIFLIVLTLGGLAIERLDMINDLAIATRDNWLPSHHWSAPGDGDCQGAQK